MASKAKEFRRVESGKALVERNTYKCYLMDDVPPIPNYKIIFPMGYFNGICAYYNVCTDFFMVEQVK